MRHAARAMGYRRRVRRSGVFLVASLVMSAVIVTGCGSDEPAVVSVPTQGGVAASGPRVLLDAQRLTVLDQPLRYPTKGKAQVSSSILVIEPGQETGWIKNPVPTYVYVLEGTITVEYDGGVVKEFRAGSALIDAVGVWHNGTNTGVETARMLVVSMGAKGVKNAVERP